MREVYFLFSIMLVSLLKSKSNEIMDFWENLIRYPRFFISSLLGLILILITPLIKVYNETGNKKFLLLLFFSSIVTLFWIFNLMLYSDQ